MRKLHFFNTFAVITVLAFTAFTQQPSDPTPTPTPDETAEKIKEEAVALIRTTLQDVGGMRTIENRISFTSELAGLMWYHDQREASALFSGVVNDYKTLISQYDTQMNSLQMAGASPNDYGGGLFGPEPTDMSRLSRKARVASMVRQQIAMSLAEHVPELALNFFYDSISIVTNESLKRQLSSGDEQFEFKLIARIAESNLDRAVELTEDSLKKGLNYNHISLLKQVYEKDQDKGIIFGGKVLSAFKSTDKDTLSDHVTSSLLQLGIEKLDASQKEPAKKPLYTQAELRDIADQFAMKILQEGEEYERWSAMSYARTIEKVLPSRAAQIRAKYPEPPAGNGSGRGGAVLSTGISVPPPPMAITGSSGTGVRVGDPNSDPQLIAKAKVEENMKKLGMAELPKEERDKIIAEARRLINDQRSREAKIMALSMLAAQVRKAGDGQLSSEIMLDASRLVNPHPKHIRDMMLTLVLIAGYAETEPENAFALIEQTIYRANELLAAAAKIGEFVDVNEEMFVDGEMQVGAFGGDMVRELTSSLGMAESTVSKLVKTDFAKTRALTDRFDRVETRVLAKMVILRTVLGKKDKNTKPGEIIGLATDF